MKELKEYLNESNLSKFDKEIKNFDLVEQRYKIKKHSISNDLHKHIKDNFEKVKNSSAKPGKWYKVYNGDSKYGQYMVNFDKKVWANVDFDQFYGGGVVD